VLARPKGKKERALPDLSERSAAQPYIFFILPNKDEQSSLVFPCLSVTQSDLSEGKGPR
jgi:hypothetical protein